MRRSFIRSAAASPATEFGSTLAMIQEQDSAADSRGADAELRSSTGPCPKSGIFGTPISKILSGKRVVDFQECNLHVLNYSTPVHATMPLSELKPHLFTLPEHPDWIPYRTSYYQENWGFCLSHNQMLALKDGKYEVCIDSTLEDGHLTYGECYLPGRL